MLAIISACGHQGCSERHQRELCDFEALQSERDSDDRNAESHAYGGSGQCDFDASEEYPKYIEQQRYGCRTVTDFLSERKEGKCCEFEALHADRNADYGDTP